MNAEETESIQNAIDKCALAGDYASSSTGGGGRKAPKPKEVTAEEKVKTDTLKSLRKDLSKVKSYISSMELKSERLSKLDPLYVAKQLYTDLEKLTQKLTETKTWLMNQVVMVENMNAGIVNGAIAGDSTLRLEQCTKQYEEVKDKLKTLNI